MCNANTRVLRFVVSQNRFFSLCYIVRVALRTVIGLAEVALSEHYLN